MQQWPGVEAARVFHVAVRPQKELGRRDSQPQCLLPQVR